MGFLVLTESWLPFFMHAIRKQQIALGVQGNVVMEFLVTTNYRSVNENGEFQKNVQ